MSFFESPRFPDCIAAGSRGGPSWLTEVVAFASGREQRNLRWSAQRHVYDVSFGVHVIDDLEQLIAFFHGVRGKTHGFRFKDYADYKSCGINEDITAIDQTLTVISGSTTEYQLSKSYDYLSPGYTREITKPVVGTTVVAIDDVTQSSGWSIDTTTGIITFTGAPGGTVTAGFEFDVPCRFDTDTLMVQLEAIKAGSAEMPIVEIRI